MEKTNTNKSILSSNINCNSKCSYCLWYDKCQSKDEEELLIEYFNEFEYILEDMVCDFFHSSDEDDQNDIITYNECLKERYKSYQEIINEMADY